MDESLLLYSLREHRALILDVLAAVAAGRVVEIGSEAGGFTREMAAWAEENGARFVAVEPFPAEEIRELAEGSSAFELVEARSPDALAGIEPADAYLVDGDHNHWTVSGELQAIYSDGREPVAIKTLSPVSLLPPTSTVCGSTNWT